MHKKEVIKKGAKKFGGHFVKIDKNFPFWGEQEEGKKAKKGEFSFSTVVIDALNELHQHLTSSTFYRLWIT